MNMLSCSDLDVAIGDVQICHNLTLSMAAGQCWGILGRNGVGKTTLLHTLANLHKPRRGEVQLLGRALAEMPRRQLARTLALLIQSDQHPFPASVLETALMGRHPYISPWRSETEADLRIALEALQAVAMDTMADRQIDTLSGGERQRLALAAILAQAPQVVLLDEPTNHLDLHFQVSLLNLFTQKNRSEQKLLLMTLHDLNLAARFCDHLILLLGDGEVIFGPAEDMLHPELLQRLYRHSIVKVQTDHGYAFIPK